jgi:acyl-CoA hydrolase
MPAQLLNALAHRRDLKLHTGMIGDAALNLVAAGALRDGESLVTGVAVGTDRFYGKLASVRGLTLAAVGFTHAPQTLSLVPRFHAVNSAL